MVDFQSRDTRRGPTTDDESPDDGGGEAGTDEQVDDGSEPGVRKGTDEGDTAQSDAGPTVGGDTADAPGTGSGTTVAEDTPDAPGTDAGEPTESDGTATASGGPPASTTAPEAQPTPSRTIDVAVVTIGTETFEPLEGSVTTAFESAGHRVATRERLRGGYDAVQQMVESLAGREDVDAVVTVGGVGIAADELTIEAVHPLLEKALPGFGEAFRSLLFDHVGTGVVGVRSTAGVADGTLVFCLPADAEAAGLAVEEILAVEAPELVAQLG